MTILIESNLPKVIKKLFLTMLLILFCIFGVLISLNLNWPLIYIFPNI